jgi:LmbE family N-acetylglucosaminyl deacetylase
MDIHKALVIAAHPDDDILGCGATLHKLVAEGHDVRVVFLGEGSTCRFAPDELDARAEAIAQRQTFAKAALAVLGVTDYAFNDLPCGRFDTVPIVEIAALVEREVATYAPDTVFTHFAHDVNNDHQLTFQAVLQSTRPGSPSAVRHVLSFEVLSTSEWRFIESFQPQLFVNAEAHLAAKVAALACYETEVRDFPFPRSAEGVEAQAKTRGMQAGLAAAEAFMVVRSIEP